MLGFLARVFARKDHGTAVQPASTVVTAKPQGVRLTYLLSGRRGGNAHAGGRSRSVQGNARAA